MGEVLRFAAICLFVGLGGFISHKMFSKRIKTFTIVINCNGIKVKSSFYKK